MLNLTDKINKQLPQDLVDFMHLAGETAAAENQRLFLVGGVVRDILLETENFDLDIVTEGDAIQLASKLADIKMGSVIAHSRFNTAKIQWDRWTVDIATTRIESYDHPGALPRVKCNHDIECDLFRRDFTINAMAVHLNPDRFGVLIDIFKGQSDLDRKIIRILHDESFQDDATRIWRAVRYEQRLGFRIERNTMLLLKRHLPYLDSISGDRVRNELELMLMEPKPDKILRRATKLGLLQHIVPSLRLDDDVARKMARAATMMQPYTPPSEMLLAFLIYRLPTVDLEKFLEYLRIPRSPSAVLKDTLRLKMELHKLNVENITQAGIYKILNPYARTAILVNMILTDSLLIKNRIDLYLNKLAHIRPSLSGDDLKTLGYSGPSIKYALELIRTARLEGSAKTIEDEIELVTKLGQ